MPLRFRPLLLTACLIFCLSAGSFRCAQANGSASSFSQEAIPTISASGLHTLEKKKKPFLLLDVRQPEEYNQGHIQSAVLLPLDNLPQHFKELPKKKKIVVYCRSGKRSAQAVSFLRTHGYTNAISLSGGYMEWLDSQHLRKKKQSVCSTAEGCIGG